MLGEDCDIIQHTFAGLHSHLTSWVHERPKFPRNGNFIVVLSNMRDVEVKMLKISMS